MLLRPFLPLLLLVAAAPGRAAELRVLPESAEYCEDLASRLARLPRSRQDPARSLGAEGLQLCRRGEIHSGVDRLRRALRAAQPPRHAEE
jgi:hypothetical protein